MYWALLLQNCLFIYSFIYSFICIYVCMYVYIYIYIYIVKSLEFSKIKIVAMTKWQRGQFIKICWSKSWRKWNYTFKKLSTPLSTTTEKINLSNMFLTKHEIEILKLGLSFIATPKHNTFELETDIYYFIRKLRSTYHFRYWTYEDKLLKINLHLLQKIM